MVRLRDPVCKLDLLLRQRRIRLHRTQDRLEREPVHIRLRHKLQHESFRFAVPRAKGHNDALPRLHGKILRNLIGEQPVHVCMGNIDDNARVHAVPLTFHNSSIYYSICMIAAKGLPPFPKGA